MFAWIRELTGQERKTLIATYGGWSVDAFDFMIYTRAGGCELSRATDLSPKRRKGAEETQRKSKREG